MTRKLLFHIGLPKTGTTAIQQFLSLNYERLRQHGILYPSSLRQTASGSLCHAHASVAFSFDVCDYSQARKQQWSHWRQIDDQDIENFKQELTPGQSDIVVISSENMSCKNNVRRQLGNMKSVFEQIDDFKMQVVVYLRRQDLFLESENYHRILSGKKTLKTHVDINYLQLIEQYSDIFGRANVIIRLFEDAQLHRGNAINDFMTLVGFDDIDGFDLPPKRQGNHRLPIEFSELYRHSAEHLNAQERAIFMQRLKSLAEDGDDGPAYTYLSRVERKRVLADHRAINEQIARQFLGREDGALFREQFPSKDIDLPTWPGLEPAAARTLMGKLFPAPEHERSSDPPFQ